MVTPVWIWVRVRICKDDGANEADVPDGVRYAWDDSITERFPTTQNMEQKVTVYQYANVGVAPDDVDKCSQIPADQVPEEARLAIQMVRHCRGDYNGKADTFFDSIPDIATADATRKRIVEDVLVQAKARGLSDEKADAIDQRLKLRG